jgi:hypothetical protein
MSIIKLDENQLNEVVGGSTFYTIMKCDDGGLIIYKSSYSGDVDSLKKLINGGSVNKINVSGETSIMKVNAKKADAFLKNLGQKKDVAIAFVDKL